MLPGPVVELLSYQRAAVESEARFTWHCWARQTGKSFTLSLRRVLRGLARRRNQIILSAGARQSREVMEKVRMHCSALKVWCEVHGDGYWRGSSVRRLEARLPGGVRIIALPANPMTARGFTGDVLLDEFAMHADDEAIWSALFPTLLRGAGELDVASTPRGRKNVFHRLRNNDSFERRTVTLADAVGAGLDVDMAAMRAAIDDEIAWRQEFCCEFVDEATAFITHDLIRSCQDVRLETAVDWSRLEARHAEIYVGVDVGRFRDVTVVWLWERVRGAGPKSRKVETSKSRNIETSRSRNVEMSKSQNVVSSMARRSAVADVDFVTRGVVVLRAAPFAEQEDVIASVLSHRAVRRCCIDATGLGLQLAERLTQWFGNHRVEGVTFTAALKSELAGSLRVTAERGQLRIPADDAIANDWHALSRIVTPAGNVRYDADRSSGGHADRFWAAALGLHAAEGAMHGEAGLLTSGPMRFGFWWLNRRNTARLGLRRSARRRTKVPSVEYKYASLIDYVMANPLSVNGMLDDGWGASFPVKGIETVAAVLFADISAFTARTQDLSPTETLVYVNNFFAWITAEALRGGNGIVDKYIGDEIMVVFSRDFGSTDPFLDALVAARWMAENDALNYLPRMGIAYGPVTCGIVGTPLRFDCSVFGQPVAMAKRCAELRPAASPDEKLVLGTSIAFPEGLWRGRSLDDVFTPRRYRDPDGKTIEMDVPWKLSAPRRVALKNMPETEIREIRMTTLRRTSRSVEDRARVSLALLQQSGAYRPRTIEGGSTTKEGVEPNEG